MRYPGMEPDDPNQKKREHRASIRSPLRLAIFSAAILLLGVLSLRLMDASAGAGMF